MSSVPKRIVVLGGGFGGVYAASFLEKMLRPEEAAIWLVNRENYFVYQPMLAEVISGSIGLTDVVSPIRRLCPRTQLVMREVEEIDLQNRVVAVSPGFRPRRLELPYDYLVISLGGITDFHGMPGMVEHTLPFRTLADAIILRNRVIHALEEADVETDPEFRRKLLTFVVGGGGFSGVEVVAELNDFVRGVARHYPRLPREEIRTVLVHSGERILPEMDEGLALFAQTLLSKRGVEMRLKDRLVAATSEKALLKSGGEIPAKTIVSTVPSAIAPVLKRLDCTKENGRLLVDEHLELRGYEGQVWVLGDCAFIRTASGKPVPPTAQHATREAHIVATNIRAAMGAGQRAAFRFEGLGKLGALGHNSAVAEILGVRVHGFPAWLLWRTIYLMKMPGLNRKVRVAADWFNALLFPPDLVQLSVHRASGIAEQHFAPGEVVFNQGDLGDCVYVIRKGECEVLREKEGAQQLLAVLADGDYFGEMAVLSDTSRNATVRARSAVDVLLIPKADFNKLKTTVPAFGEVFRALAKSRAPEPE
ncbi:MAG: FAD-dependent oxidoreductase [Candidatus Solibacter usitatus]|nr:FAD-dependent oxidoreductase [Candidatus Solibacter usitatus]